MKLAGTLIAVKSVEKSKEFYCNLFEQKVLFDFGWNVAFDGGFAIQKNFAWLIDVDKNSVLEKTHNMELYFEVDDFDEFIKKLKNYDVEYVHPPKKHDWQQRVVRIYDPDYHIIEIGESMVVITKKYLKDGYSVEETAKIIQHPVDFVEMCKNTI